MKDYIKSRTNFYLLGKSHIFTWIIIKYWIALELFFFQAIKTKNTKDRQQTYTQVYQKILDDKFNNYRTMSNLPFLEKILEIIVY